MEQLHGTTNATLFWGLYWVTSASATAFGLAVLGAAGYYCVPWLLRMVRRLLAQRRPSSCGGR